MKKLVPDPPPASLHTISRAPGQAETQDTPTTWSTAGRTTCMELYRIQPGISFQHAFSELSVLLGCIRHLTCEAEMESDLIAGSSARILSAMAKALIDDMELGMNRQTE